jgi:hypothetical protein
MGWPHQRVKRRQLRRLRFAINVGNSEGGIALAGKVRIIPR